MRRIAISDCTLKNIAKEGGVSLLFREKTAVARCIDRFGADAIELSPVKNPKEDAIICKTIGSFANAVLCVEAGSTKESIAQAWECVKTAKKPRLEIALPVSTVQMEYTYHLKAEKMSLKVAELVRAAKELCDDVQFTALDATRADSAFLLSVCKLAQESGAASVCISDDVGTCLPEEISALVSELKNELSVPLWVRPSGAISLGVANALAALRAGADGIKCAIYGKDSVKTGKLASALCAAGEKAGITTDLCYSEINSDIEALLSKIGFSERGETSFSPDDSSDVLLDGDSTMGDVRTSAVKLGYDLSEPDVGSVFAALRAHLRSRSSIGKKEFEAIIASSAMQVPSTYHLDSFTTLASNKTSATSHIVLTSGDERFEGVAVGDGPIDSAFKAIEQSIGCHYELDNFEIQAVTEGKEALGSAIVRLRSGGKLFSGNGLSADIVGASIRAYINALNKIVYEDRK